MITAHNVLLIHDDSLLASSWRCPEAGLLRLFGNDPVLVHVGGAAQVHEAATEGADVVDVRMVEGGTVFAGAWVVIAVELGWLHLPELRLLDLDVMVELQWPVFFEHRQAVVLGSIHAHDLTLMQALGTRDLTHVIEVIPEKLIVCFEAAVAVAVVFEGRVENVAL